MSRPKTRNQLVPIPKFTSEAAEQAFWETADTTKYFDYSKARTVVLPNLEPTTTPISMRLPETCRDARRSSLSTEGEHVASASGVARVSVCA